MTINSVFVFEALLQHNYLPAQRRKQEEMPPVFDSKTFTPEAALPLLTMKPASGAKGFDLVDYRATKFNSISRSYSIPHPVGYSQLAACIKDNWAAIEPLQSSHVSMIRPREHRDGRLIIMDYENFETRSKRMRHLAFGQRYTARTDIANCFPSIYKHAVPWAAVGVAAAKAETKGGWYNDLDRCARRTVRDETQGVPVGPATSNVIAELILGRVDKELESELNFVRGAGLNGMSRFIDDYTFHCDSYDEAEKFIRRLEEELGKYKLKLNSKKTSISNSVTPFSDGWAVELALRRPSGDPLNAPQATNYLEFASALALKFPEGSVLKYAANALLSCRLNASAAKATLDYLLILAMQSPVLLPTLSKLIHATSFGGVMLFEDRFLRIVNDCAVRHRSDGMAWGLYYLTKYDVAIPVALAELILKTKDCIAILMLYVTGQHNALVVDWTSTLDKENPYELDRYWILLYQLFKDGMVSADLSSVPASFIALKAGGVNFVLPVT